MTTGSGWKWPGAADVRSGPASDPLDDIHAAAVRCTRLDGVDDGENNSWTEQSSTHGAGSLMNRQTSDQRPSTSTRYPSLWDASRHPGSLKLRPHPSWTKGKKAYTIDGGDTDTDTEVVDRLTCIYVRHGTCRHDRGAWPWTMLPPPYVYPDTIFVRIYGTPPDCQLLLKVSMYKVVTGHISMIYM